MAEERVTISALSQARITESWQHYQEELTRAIAPLTDQQMSLRPIPGLRSIGEIAEHIVKARAFWLPRVLDNTNLEPMASWDDPDDPPRTAAEVQHGLNQTWQVISACLSHWTADALRDTIPDEEVTRLRTIWGLMEHDLHHGGELSFALGAHGLSALDM